MDEGLASDEVSFFLAIMDALMEGARGSKYLEAKNGTRGDVYQGWRSQTDLADTEVPVDSQFLSLGKLVAAATRGGYKIRLLESTIRTDLETIIAASNSSRSTEGRLCILIDEGDILFENRALVQRLRNILNTTQNVMVVIAVTDQALQETGGLFSPILRSFTIIPLAPFSEKAETRECIELPLRKHVRDFRAPDAFVTEVHRITSGHPYLIQLFCHAWLKRQALAVNGGRSANGRGQLSFDLDKSVLSELWSLGRNLPHPGMDAFWHKVRDKMFVGEPTSR